MKISQKVISDHNLWNPSEFSQISPPKHLFLNICLQCHQESSIFLNSSHNRIIHLHYITYILHHVAQKVLRILRDSKTSCDPQSWLTVVSNSVTPIDHREQETLWTSLRKSCRPITVEKYFQLLWKEEKNSEILMQCTFNFRFLFGHVACAFTVMQWCRLI